jgi:hypothetical protein
MDQAKQTVEALGIKLGEALIPKLEAAARATSSVVSWFEKHSTVAKVLAGVIGGVLTVSILAWIGGMVKAAGASVVSFAKMIANGAKWVFATRTQMLEGEAVQEASRARALVGWIAYNAKFLALQAASMAEWVGEQAAQMASWVAMQVTQLAKSTAAGVVWLAEHAVMATTYIASNVAMAASATAAFIAENAATLGIAAAIAALIAAIIYMATHWRQVWGEVKQIALDVWHFLDSEVFQPIGNFFVAVWGGFLDGAKAAWSTMWDSIKSVLNTAWGIIKPVLDQINNAVGLIGKGIGAITSGAKAVGSVVGSVLSHIPHLAEGGVVTSPTLALIGEGGEPEYVIPQSKLGGLAPSGATRSLGGGFAGGAGGSVSINYNPTVHLNGTGNGKPVTDRDVKRMLDEHSSELVGMLSARRF